MLRGHAYVRNGARAATVSVHHQREGEFKSHVAASRHLAIGRDRSPTRQVFPPSRNNGGLGLEKVRPGVNPAFF